MWIKILGKKVVVDTVFVKCGCVLVEDMDERRNGYKVRRR